MPDHTKSEIMPTVATVGNWVIRIANASQVEQHWKHKFEQWGGGRDWQPLAKLKKLASLRQVDGRYGLWSGAMTMMEASCPAAKRQGHAAHMLKLLHFCLADPAYLPAFPPAWGALPVLPRPERAQIPFALASFLLSDVGTTFYAQCTIGTDRPGWVVKLENNHEIIWRMLPPVKEQKFDWIYESDLYNDDALRTVARQGSIAKIAKACALAEEGSKVFAVDGWDPGILAHIIGDMLDHRLADPALPGQGERDHQPIGIRPKSDTIRKGDNGEAETGVQAMALFSWSPDLTGDGVDLLYTANVQEQHVEEVLQAMDVVGHTAGKTTGKAFVPAANNLFWEVVRAMPERLIRAGPRAEMDGHLIGVAWYGEEHGKARYLDYDVVAWM